jgi:NAD(P)H-hydrate repair Nnr-like enzyme with NAD(P)H-hydrate dehydratase domain
VRGGAQGLWHRHRGTWLPPAINSSGNALLATAGTGDVLAGMLGAAMAGGLEAFEAACGAVYAHGRIADEWPAGQALTASALARRA